MDKTDSPCFLVEEDFAIYREKSKRFMSSHQLADFRKCPALWHRKSIGIIPDIDSPAKAFGRAAHCLILEGRDKFEETFAIGGPLNEKTGKEYGNETIKYAEWFSASGKKESINTSDIKIVRQMRDAINCHPTAYPLLQKRGVPERVTRADLHELPCQIRIDWFSEEIGIVDLKTTRDLDRFEYEIKDYGYANQMAFYRSVFLASNSQAKAPTIHIIAVEKQEPYRVGVWKFMDSILNKSEKENEAAIRRFLKCKVASHFPTDYEHVRFVV